VKGVAEHDVRADLHQFRRAHRLHRAVGADRHERGCLDRAMRDGERAAPRRAVSGEEFEFHRRSSAFIGGSFAL
jgi:hypothetical protein